MAPPDPASYASSADVFSSNLTLPQIRSLHKTLHVQIDEKASRLRTQVGGSYRELLGTADTIVQMHSDNKDVQQLLGAMGGRCGRGVVTSKASSLQKFVTQQDYTATSVAARQRLLEACALVAERILKGGSGLRESATKGDRLVLAAKVLSLSRLLLKSFADAKLGDRARQSVEALKKTLDGLRRRLRRGVEKLLERPGDDAQREDVLKALCVPSLTASSGAKDALRFFLDVRKNAMTNAFEVEDGERSRTTESVMHALRLYTRTLLDVQALLPLKLPDALSALKEHSLLEDKALQEMENLRLDLYQRWCTEEIQYFTPFIRHDDLDGTQARDMLSSWAEQGAKCLIDGLKRTLEEMVDYKSIMELRTEVLRLWIRDGGKAKCLDPLEMQQDLREVINARMLAVLETKVSKLRLVGSEVKATLEGWQRGVSDKTAPLWDDTGYDEALSVGAAPFVQEVVSRLYGRNNAVSKAVHSYMSWYRVIDDVKDVVESLKKQRWDNDYDEVEDEETIEERQRILSKEDPKMLQDKLETTLDKTYKALEEQLGELWDGKKDEQSSAAIAAYFLRVLRDVRSKLPQRPGIEKFGLDMVPTLHAKVAGSVATSSVDEFASVGLSVRTISGKPLWEGEPALPTQPSPEVFTFLHSLYGTLAEVGVDLWTPTAIKVLKRQLGEKLCDAWEKELLSFAGQTDTKQSEPGASKKQKKNKKKGKPEPEAAPKTEDAAEDEKGDEGDDKEEQDGEQGDDRVFGKEQSQELCQQWLFDVSVLRSCIGQEESSGERLDKLAENIYKQSGLADEAARKRVVKAASGFWQRVSLLFGLLA
ncbi:hypothetical protein K4F52_009147 [Lecanicillium sp. MT-2017a]|nr:hypothetical protein K4F52_009147 [Lecanicillium sp. MT-2017a]